jgi:hypothetical protein
VGARIAAGSIPLGGFFRYRGKGKLMKDLLIFAAATWVGVLAPRLLSQDMLGGWSTAFPPNTMDLAEVKQNDRLALFVLKNVSGKDITAFAVRLSSDTTDSVDFFEAQNDLKPGDSYSLRVGKREPSDHILRLLAVIFRDGSAVGEPDALDSIRGRRLGLTVEIERVTGILSSLTNASADEASVAALKGRIGSLPQSPEEAVASVQGVPLDGVDLDHVKNAGSFTDGFQLGVSDAREAALWKVNQLAQLQVSARAQPSRNGALLDLRRMYEALSARNRILMNQKGVIHP